MTVLLQDEDILGTETDMHMKTVRPCEQEGRQHTKEPKDC